MDGIYSITRPELLTVTQGERSWQGADQLWYADEWQQKAGCGPTAAAVMASYLAQTRHSCAPLYPSGSWERRDVLALMEELWGSLTPGKDADVVVTDRHPLDWLGRVTAVFIGGVRVK